MKRRGCLPSVRGCIGLLFLVLIVAAIIGRAPKTPPAATSSGLAVRLADTAAAPAIAPTNQPASFVVTSTPLPTPYPRPTDSTSMPESMLVASTAVQRVIAPTQTAYLQYWVSSGQAVNVRSDSTTTSTKLGAFAAGAPVTVVGVTQGQSVSGSTLWYKVIYQDQTGYVHSSLLADHLVTPRPAATAVPQVFSTRPPVQQPAPSVNVAASGDPFGCNGMDDLNCSDFRGRGISANAHLAMCGDEDNLDGDGDGHACEK